MNRRKFMAGGALAAIASGAGYLAASRDTTEKQTVIPLALRAAAAVTALGYETTRRDGGQLSAPLIRRSFGSAVFIDRDGLALTNSHVVSGSLDITLLDARQRQWQAEIVADDPMTDLALIKVNADAPAILQLDEHPLSSGVPIVAIGAPYEYFASVSNGIVSGLRRARRRSAPAIFFQHTAMINPGSSGGAVVDGRGRLVGINTAVPDSQFAFAGISLAIEARIIGLWLSRFRKTGTFYRSAYGLALYVSEFAQSAIPDGEAYTEAVMVQSVARDGPAAGSAIRAGDQIVSFNGRPVVSQSELLADMLVAEPGQGHRIGLSRGGDVLECSIVPQRLVLRPQMTTSSGRSLGFVLSPGDPPSVESVAPGSPADYSGLRAGDRICAIGDEAVHSMEQAQIRLAQYPLVVPMAVSRDEGDIRWINLGAADTGGVIAGNNLGVGSFSI